MDWQPIAECPKTYLEDVLLFAPDLGICFAHWDDDAPNSVPTPGWYSERFDEPITETITHWMPLPGKPPPDCIDCNDMPCWEAEDGELILVVDPDSWNRLTPEERATVTGDAAI